MNPSESNPPNELPTSRDELVIQYRPYVRNIVGKVFKSVSRDIDFDDLVSYGEIGLIEAAERFDPKFNVSFMTFAYYRIRGAIYDGLRGMGWLSRAHYAKNRYEERSNQYLESINNRNAGAIGTPTSTKDEVHQISEVISGLASIYITSIDASESIQVQSEDPQDDPFYQYEHSQTSVILRQAIKQLPEQERTLLECYYYKDMTLESAGSKLGLSKSWASRLHSRAIQRLQKLIQELNPNQEEDE